MRNAVAVSFLALLLQGQSTIVNWEKEKTEILQHYGALVPSVFFPEKCSRPEPLSPRSQRKVQIRAKGASGTPMEGMTVDITFQQKAESLATNINQPRSVGFEEEAFAHY